jgi:hypothetical protein
LHETTPSPLLRPLEQKDRLIEQQKQAISDKEIAFSERQKVIADRDHAIEERKACGFCVKYWICKIS